MAKINTNATATFKGRILALGALISLVLFFYIVHLFLMQIVNGGQYKKRAAIISQRAMTLFAKRGEIFDRNIDVPLVDNIDSFQVDFNPADVQSNKIPLVLSKLSSLIKVPFTDLDSKIPASSYHVFQNIEIKKGVDFADISKIAERIDELPGVSWEDDPIRHYVDTGSLANVLGYVGNITQEELQVLYNQGYGIRSIVGKNGIEKKYDLVLRGKNGKIFRTVDVNGRRVANATENEIPPEPGKDLVLTIDRRIQRLAEKALGPRNGSVIVLKPSTGEVLAMVSYPYYDANKFYTDQASTYFNQLETDPAFPFLNRPIQAAYPPGSTFKIIMTTAALGDKVIDPDKKIFCGPSYKLASQVYKEHIWPLGYGWIDLGSALADSADVFFYQLGQEYLGIDRIDDYSKRFGLGQPTGIDLPDEVSGLLPTPKWKERVLNYPWLGGDTVNLSIGQGYLLVTPIQMADAVAMIVNNGKIFRPFLVKEILDPITKKPLQTIKPELEYEINLPSEIWKEVRADMRGVITKGTAAVVMTTRAVEIAGKTGTAEDGKKGSSNHSWFVAFAPYNETDPSKQIVVVVQVEKTNKWEWWAPKAANIIFHGIFKHETYEEAVKDLHPWYMPSS
jgi:penicillin-binding protein 2